MKVEIEEIGFSPPTAEEQTELARKIEWFKEFTSKQSEVKQNEHRQEQSNRVAIQLQKL